MYRLRNKIQLPRINSDGLNLYFLSYKITIQVLNNFIYENVPKVILQGINNIIIIMNF